jgi:tRNA(Ile)-lysidine synthase
MPESYLARSSIERLDDATYVQRVHGAAYQKPQFSSELSITLAILDNLPKEIIFDEDACFTIGLSGGVDSVVLLHLFKLLQTQFKFKLQAVHVNHNISVNAPLWQDFCEKLCSELNVPLTVFQHTVSRNGGESLENNARKLRYQSFAEFYITHNNDNNNRDNDDKSTNTEFTKTKPIMVLAHHQDDQIETILSQIFRGSDLHNIAAMQPISMKLVSIKETKQKDELEQGLEHRTQGMQQQLFWRPLLNITKQNILDYAISYGLTHIEDESNSDTTYLRNFLRNDILPSLQTWDPHINNKILKFNHYVKNATLLMDEVAQSDFMDTKFQNDNSNTIDTANSNTIGVIKFTQLSMIRQHNLISYFILLNQNALPSDKQINEFCRQVAGSAWDRTPELKLSDTCKIKKYKNQILIIDN